MQEIEPDLTPNEMQDNTSATPIQQIQTIDTEISVSEIAQALPPVIKTSFSVFDVQKMEAMFSLKLMSKFMLPQDQINDILFFSTSIQNAKLDIIKQSLQNNYSSEEKIQEICRDIDIVGSAAGLGEKISTHYKRQQYIQTHFDYVQPRRQPIKNAEGIEVAFYMDLPIYETLRRFLADPTLRRYIIKDCIIPAKFSVF